MSKLNIIPVFVPHYGCPNDCIFCNQRKITNKDYADDLKQTRLDIEEYLTFFSDKKNETQIAFYGGSFTGLNFNVMVDYLNLANEFIKIGEVNSIRLSTRPDYIDGKILNTLKEKQVKTIELGVQSLDNDVLKSNNRGHSAEIVYKASKLIKKFGFELGLQQMIGLYKDDKEKDWFTAKEFVKINPKYVRIYPTLIIKDTYLETLYLSGKYNALTLEQAIEIIKPIYILYELNDIEIIRVGLQPTDNINENGDIVAGPFHAAFRQLVVQEVYKDIVECYLKEFKDTSSIEIFCSNKEISYVVGNGGTNKKQLIKKFNIKRFKISGQREGTFKIFSKEEHVEVDIKKYYKYYLNKR
ncbi:elongator complex protein 3 [Miniphocaeibacter massiliensis]|uniref:elongator complex protein 3 n=1 Tax=Miniphocaeibacter massiliensis TaxID=2041841 RepID=UPI000C077E55|nr:radical SAM protein [Miniphocaeibacter massiliensis]